MMKRILIVAGEASGDLHGAALAEELLRLAPGLRLEGMGGRRMREAGVFLHCPADQVSVVGVFEVAGKLKALLRAFLTLRRILHQAPPDLLILIDYPDFNLLLARMAKRSGIPMVYFISPQVWAWRRGRIRVIKRLIKKMLVILPFEEELYRREGVEALFVGHPLLDRLARVPPKEEVRSRFGGGRLVGLLPGSRREELKRHLPVMLEAAKAIWAKAPDVRFIIALADVFDPADVRPFLPDDLPVEVVQGKTYEVMRASDLLIVASGTATLEAALLETPMIIIYRLSLFSALIGRLVIKVPSIGLVNLVAGRKVVPELLQYQASPARIASLALSFLNSPDLLRSIRQELSRVRTALGAPGAIRRAAKEILQVVGIGC